MRFVVDAQLPRRLALVIGDWGEEAIHRLDLPERNCPTDNAILAKAQSQQFVVVTKDEDFVDSFQLKRKPEKLLLIATRNTSNTDQC
ncbi:MAG: DUF5615 family PIN-like protein [Verrucomicrobiales bacterium]